MAIEWFRQPTWSPQTEAEFFARLAKSRGAFQKAQYLRIQAHCLQTEGGAADLPVAVRLLEMLVRDYPDESQLALALKQLAECLDRMNKPDQALAAYEQSFEAMRAHPGVYGNQAQSYGMFCAKRKLVAEYDKVLRRLSDEEHTIAFPLQRYNENAIKALIFDSRKKFNEARAFAKAAIEASGADHSGFHRHAKLGLVEHVDEEIHDALKRIAKQ